MNQNTLSLVKEVPITDLIGKKIVKTEESKKQETIFYTTDNEKYILKHETFKNKDIMGDINDLMNSSITYSSGNQGYGNFWTDLRLATIGSRLVIKWYPDYGVVKRKIANKERCQSG